MSSSQLRKQFCAAPPAPGRSQISVKDETCQHKSPGVRLLVFSSFSQCFIQTERWVRLDDLVFLILYSSDVFESVLERFVKARGEWMWDSSWDSAELFNMQLRIQASLRLLEKLHINNSLQQAASKEAPGRNIPYFILCQKAKLDF